MKALEDTKSEKRITFNLYDCWNAIAIKDRIPSLKQMNKKDIMIFKDNSVLLDLRDNSASPILHIIGQNLLYDLDHDITGLTLTEVPRRTMLSRITDHYLEVIANNVPIAFEAEFVNIHHEKALYRGILLPFSDDNEKINFILGGMRWLLVNDISVNDNEPSIDDLINQISDEHRSEPADVLTQESDVINNEDDDKDQLEMSRDDPEETDEYSIEDLMQEVAGGRQDVTTTEEELTFDEDEILSNDTDHYETDSHENVRDTHIDPLDEADILIENTLINENEELSLSDENELNRQQTVNADVDDDFVENLDTEEFLESNMDPVQTNPDEMVSLENDPEPISGASPIMKEEYTFASVLQKFANLSVELSDITEPSSAINTALDEDMVLAESVHTSHFHPQNIEHEDMDDSEINLSDHTDAHGDISFEDDDEDVVGLVSSEDDELQNFSNSVENSENIPFNESEDMSRQLERVSKQFDGDHISHSDDIELVDDSFETQTAQTTQSLPTEDQIFQEADQEPTIEELMRAAIESFQNSDEDPEELSTEALYSAEEDDLASEGELEEEILIEEEKTVSKKSDELENDDSNLDLSDEILEDSDEALIEDVIIHETIETFDPETSLEVQDDSDEIEVEIINNDPSDESLKESNALEDNSSETVSGLSEEEIKFYTELQTIPIEPTYLADAFDEKEVNEHASVEELPVVPKEDIKEKTALSVDKTIIDDPLLNKKDLPESTEIETKYIAPQSLQKTLEQITKYIEKEDQNHNRSRDSLYNILTAIYGFYEHCENLPVEFQEILTKNNLKIQARAPYTPVLKLCLGHDYDKTRLTEYSAAMWLAHETGINKNDFQSYIRTFPGGIKGCVKEARSYKKTGRPSHTALGETLSLSEIRDVIRKMPPIVRFRLNKEMATTNDEEFCLLLAKYVGQDISVLQIIDDNSLKLESILKRIAIAHKKIAPKTRRITIRRK